MVDETNVRRMKKDDTPLLSELSSEVYRQKIPSKYFVWRFLKNPLKKNWAFVAESKNKIKGLATLTPLPVFSKGQKYIVGVSGTSMIHPSIQRRGIYTKLAKYMYNVAYDEGCDFIFGFPNNNSHYGRITKLGWFDIYEIPSFSKVIKRSCVGKSYDVEFRPIKEVDLQRINDKWNSQKIVYNKNLSLSREKVFLDWRFNHPINKYYIFRCKNSEEELIVKYFEKEKKKKEIDILLINSSDNDDLFELIVKLISYSAVNNIVKINMWLNHYSNKYQLFESLGFRHESPITWFSGRKSKGTKAIFMSYENWNISFAISDLY